MHRASRCRVAGLVFATAAAVAVGHSQTLQITPSRVLIDQTVRICATGLQPNEHIVMEARLRDGRDATWQSQAEFVADAQGTVDLSTQAPKQGTYKEVSGMGLIWSMMPTEKGVGAYRPPPRFGTQQIQLELLRDGKGIANAELQQDSIAEGVKQIKVTGNLHGTLFVPADSAPHPGVLVVGGSEGGLPAFRAAWLASHGYAAFALAYFRYEGLPQRLEAIPLEYFGQALGWMMTRPEISRDKIAVMGASRGGELALQLASMYPRIKAAVAYVPANVRYRACCGENGVAYAWTWKGLPLPFARGNERGRDAFDAAIKVENTQGPILMIGGKDDHVWDSAAMVAAAASRLKQAHFAYEVETLIYPHAGHIAGRPEIVPEWSEKVRHPVSGRMIDFGGTPAGNAQSSIDAIPKVLDFLRRNLSATSVPGKVGPTQ
ncbi:MAG: acyl-CoA thioesterase/BAAT N-terminal domain-containing protein [Acidobacteriaceae bacterium]|nr:acyl-CoA thioesterase/BAAT N-terminal domain-containing protein [Acidobacteriaceae bacterium]